MSFEVKKVYTPKWKGVILTDGKGGCVEIDEESYTSFMLAANVIMKLNIDEGW